MLSLYTNYQNDVSKAIYYLQNCGGTGTYSADSLVN